MDVDEEEKPLIKLFGSEPKVFDPDAFIYQYQKKDTYGYEFLLNSLLIEEYISLTLNHINIPISLYNLGFEGVKSVKSFDKGFDINFFDINIQHQVYFAPNFSLKMQLNEPKKFEKPIAYDAAQLNKIFKEVKNNNYLQSFEYKKENYILNLSFSSIKNQVIIILKDINLQLLLYEIVINNVSQINIIEEKSKRLLIYQQDSDQILQVTFNPYFLLNISEQEWLDKINAYRNL